MTERVERVIAAIDGGLQRAGDDSYGTDIAEDSSLCARCQHHQPAEGGDLCGGCRAFLLEDTDTDPAVPLRPSSTYLSHQDLAEMRDAWGGYVGDILEVANADDHIEVRARLNDRGSELFQRIYMNPQHVSIQGRAVPAPLIIDDLPGLPVTLWQRDLIRRWHAIERRAAELAAVSGRPVDECRRLIETVSRLTHIDPAELTPARCADLADALVQALLPPMRQIVEQFTATFEAIKQVLAGADRTIEQLREDLHAFSIEPPAVLQAREREARRIRLEARRAGRGGWGRSYPARARR